MDMKIPYAVNKIFYSIQGEGAHTGTPSIFIRLSGCNMNPPCSWCDTEESKEPYVMSGDDVFDWVTIIAEKSGCERIVWTGGEPLLQLNQKHEIVRELNLHGYTQAVETNGTILPLGHVAKEIDWLTISPKAHKFMNDQESFAILSCANEIKIVFTRMLYSATEFDYLVEAIEDNFSCSDILFYIQPLSEFIEPAKDWVMAHPNWRLSIQTQKIIDMP